LAKALEIRLLPKRKVSEAEKEAEVEKLRRCHRMGEDSAGSDEETDPATISASQIRKQSFGKARPTFPTMSWTPPAGRV